MKYLIIGNGAAGIAAAEKLRKLDSKGEITVLTSENYPIYSKCLLPDYLLGQLADDRMFIRDQDFYIKNKIKICYGHKVQDINFSSKIVVVESNCSYSVNGCAFEYDKLLIASGSTPVLPPVKGVDEESVHFLDSLDSAKKIRKNAQTARRIVIIGAGFVGLEMAFNLYKAGKEVTVVEKAPRILPSQLDPKAAKLIRDGLEEEGIRLILNTGVKEVIKTSRFSPGRLFGGNTVKGIDLEDGRKLKADMVIVAAGSKPNIGFVKHGKMEKNRGIIVDKFMRTSLEDVYAAGDVVETVDAVTGRRSLSPIWPNAVIQGECAAYNMAGIPKELGDLISMQNASEFREIPMISMGIINPEGLGYETYIDYRPVERIYRKLVVKDDVAVGMIFLGDIKNSGVVGALIRNKTNIGSIKQNILSPTFGYSEVAELV